MTAEPMQETSRWLFVVGAPRCGTTAIAKWLRGHPELCLSRPKEPHFFAMRDLRGCTIDDIRTLVRSEYVDRFFRHWDGESVLADGSVSYLYAPERLEPALRIWPSAKFIICVRNPLQMLPSLHQRHFVNGDETVRKFERAWSLVPQRRQGKSIPRGCLDPRFLDYWEAGFLGKHVSNFLRIIGRDRCLVTLHDDLVAEPRREYRRALDFLGLPDDGKSFFERHADSRDCRIAWLQHLLQRPPRIAIRFLDSDDLHNPNFAESAGPLFQKVLDVRTRILDWNEFPAERPQIDRMVLNEMREMYRDDVALLSTILNRDLDHWLADDGGEPIAIGDSRDEIRIARN
ncbi:MAG TPA: sulfotransferase [Sphingomicrobium sp.]|nr:sulfotransferase [Sphingomicrobium sp.]